MLIAIKPGASIQGIKPELALGLVILSQLEEMVSPMVITSCTDGHHMEGSKHYQGLAADIRTRHMHPVQRMDLLIAAKSALGTEFDVILEDDHLHFEYDKK